MKQQIWNRIQVLCADIDQVNWEDRRIYAAYMAQTYYYVRHSTRLLALAAAYVPVGLEAPHQRFIKHITEENKHEVLAERDLTALGFQMSEFKELESVKAFYKLQYYNVQNVSPWSLLGYILPLEVLAVEKGQALYERITKNFGAQAGTFLKVHAADDIEHVEKAFDMIEGLEASDQKAILENLELSCYLYGAMLRDLPQAALSALPKQKSS